MKIIGLILLVILIVVLLGVGPLLTIMSLNALFGLAIALNFWNWASVVWLSMCATGAVRGGVKLSKQD